MIFKSVASTAGTVIIDVTEIFFPSTARRGRNLLIRVGRLQAFGTLALSRGILFPRSPTKFPFLLVGTLAKQRWGRCDHRDAGSGSLSQEFIQRKYLKDQL